MACGLKTQSIIGGRNGSWSSRWMKMLAQNSAGQEGGEEGCASTQLVFTHFPPYLILIPSSYDENKASLLSYTVACDSCHLVDNDYSPLIHSRSVYYKPACQVHRPQKEPSLQTTTHFVQPFYNWFPLAV